MDAAEWAWRAKAAGRTAVQLGAASLRRPAWRRAALARRLNSTKEADTTEIRRALAADDWQSAHEALQRRFAGTTARFVLDTATRSHYVAAVIDRDANAASDAASRADRMLDGRYDLLGYRGLRFNGDWHYDAAHDRQAPIAFHSRVPFLDPACGDHKVIWEINRHQHWLAYGRAHWLTNDERYRDAFVAELRSWLVANPPLIGINWSSMLELGLRSISWLWALHFFARSAGPRDTEPWTVDLLLGIDRQLTHVEQNLSYYFSPNTHLLGEGLALYVAGRALPELAASERRTAIGRRVLVTEASRQIAADGGHCERSTHYHRYALDFYLLALATARITGDPLAAAFERTVDRLASAAQLLSDDHGRAPHIGDDDGGMLLPIAGRAPDDWRDSLATAGVLTGRPDLWTEAVPEETRWMTLHPALAACRMGPLARRQHGDRPPVASAALPESGFYVSRAPGAAHIVLDGGLHGFLNGGHAHADALSMTASLRGVPLLIDPGTACYTTDPALRDRFRLTAFHNTLLLDDTAQSQPAGPFHWSRTADAVTHRWRAGGAFDYFDASHGGYTPFTHRRRVFVLHTDLIVVVDEVDGAGEHKASVHWHLGPDWSANTRSRAVTLTAGADRVALRVPTGRIETFTGDRETGLGWHSPAYGRVEPTTTIRITNEGPLPATIVSVFDLNDADAVEEVEYMPVWAEAGAVAHTCAIRVGRPGSVDYVAFVEPARESQRASWRIAECETDARMLFCRTARDGDVTQLAMVDGSFVRRSGRFPVGIALGRTAPSVVFDHTTIRNYTPCAASPGL
jgi:hypothetical protein